MKKINEAANSVNIVSLLETSLIVTPTPALSEEIRAELAMPDPTNLGEAVAEELAIGIMEELEDEKQKTNADS
jgi:hypothetical protein